jgi:hypothetical protein
VVQALGQKVVFTGIFIQLYLSRPRKFKEKFSPTLFIRRTGRDLKTPEEPLCKEKEFIFFSLRQVGKAEGDLTGAQKRDGACKTPSLPYSAQINLWTLKSLTPWIPCLLHGHSHFW